MYLLSSSGPFTEMNRSEQAAAAAPTMWVFPQPGGPYKRTFDRNLKGAFANIFGNFEGNSIIWHINTKKKKKMKLQPNRYKQMQLRDI